MMHLPQVTVVFKTYPLNQALVFMTINAYVCYKIRSFMRKMPTREGITSTKTRLD
jgi:hypothetical protein